MVPELVGLVPCAGRATRLGALAGSKELLPVRLPERHDGEPAPVCLNLLGQMNRAGIRRVWIVLRDGKWDIPGALGSGAELGLDLAYLTVRETRSILETLARGYLFVRECRVAIGFPDIIATPADALARVAEHQVATGADIVLGLFPTDRPDKADMVEVDARGELVRIEIKPGVSDLRLTWLCAVWTPRVTELLHDFVVSGERLGQAARKAPDHEGAVRAEKPAREVFPSDFLLFAKATGVRIATVGFPSGSHLDIGTRDDLARAMLGSSRC